MNRPKLTAIEIEAEIQQAIRAYHKSQRGEQLTPDEELSLQAAIKEGFFLPQHKA